MLAERREPALWFHTVEKAHSKSRLGGLPSLPDSVDWPVHPDTGTPLHFLAQIDLAALPETPLPGCPLGAAPPRRGMLYFFFNFAYSWDEDFGVTDADGVPKQSRVIHAPTAGADRAAPETLPPIGYDPETMESAFGIKENFRPEQHLRAYAIDTFRGAKNEYENGKCVLPLGDEAYEAKFQSILNATGEAAPAVYPNTMDFRFPATSPSHYARVRDVGPKRVSKFMKGLQMFGAETQWDDRRVRDRSRVVLMEYPYEADELGSLQFWIEMKDLRAGRFDRIFGQGCGS
jgi:hypothetical protein